jgi:hypothetical protein
VAEQLREDKIKMKQMKDSMAEKLKEDKAKA